MVINIASELDISNVNSEISTLKTQLDKLEMPKNLSRNLEKSMGEARDSVENFEKALLNVNQKGGMKNLVSAIDDVSKKYRKLIEQTEDLEGRGNVRLKIEGLEEIDRTRAQIEAFNDDLSTLQKQAKTLSKVGIKIDDSDLIDMMTSTEAADKSIDGLRESFQKLAQEKLNVSSFDDLQSEIKDTENLLESLTAEYEKYQKQLFNADGSRREDLIAKTSGKYHTKGDWLKDVLETVEAHDRLQEEIRETELAHERLSGTSNQYKEMESSLERVIGTVKNLDGAYENFNLEEFLAEYNNAMDRAEAKTQEFVQQLGKKGRAGFDEFDDGARAASDALTDFSHSAEIAERQIEDIQSNLMNFFSFDRLWDAFIDGARQAFSIVKELDTAMTEIAVVTDYNLDEIWQMRGDYVSQATRLGSKTVDVVDASALYYQQGLSESEVRAATEETIKMARIGSLGGAEATDYMTSAIRGFNMEMEDAARINDVYSEVAAKTASDTQELATAMSKTASIAHNAGADFENITALLAMGIETTREPPESIGTAMKTIIARFQELKKAPGEVGMVDGEQVDVNKIEAALREVDIALLDTTGNFRAWDDVMFDIARNWDNMSTMQQRYLATTAAGSRQQSRFIAMVQDYQRLTDITTWAKDSEGAGTTQYEKTLDSVEAKMNSLSSQAELLTTHIFPADSMLKPAIDGLTTILSLMNGALDLAPGFLNIFKPLVAGFVGLKGIGAAQYGIRDLFDVMKSGASAGGVNWLDSFISVSRKGADRRWNQNLGDLLKRQTFDTSLFDQYQRSGRNSVAEFIKDYNKRNSDQQIEIPVELKEPKISWMGNLLKGIQGRWSKAGQDAGEGFGKTLKRSLSFISGGTGTWKDALKGGAILAGITAGIAALNAVIETVNYRSLEEKIRRANTVTEEFKKTILSTQDEIKNLGETEAHYDNMIDDLGQLTRGSLEWREAVSQVNMEVMDLLDQYSSLAEYINFSPEGLMTIGEGGWQAVQKELEAELEVQRLQLAANKTYQNELNLERTTEGNADKYKNITSERLLAHDAFENMVSEYDSRRVEVLQELSANMELAPGEYSSSFTKILNDFSVETADDLEEAIRLFEDQLAADLSAGASTANLFSTELTNALLKDKAPDSDGAVALTREEEQYIASVSNRLATQNDAFEDAYGKELKKVEDELGTMPWDENSLTEMYMAVSDALGVDIEEAQAIFGDDRAMMREAIARQNTYTGLLEEYQESFAKLREGATKGGAKGAEAFEELMRIMSHAGDAMSKIDMDNIVNSDDLEEYISGLADSLGITPEELAAAMGFGPEEMDEFYDHLRENAEKSQAQRKDLEKQFATEVFFLDPAIQKKLLTELENESNATFEQVHDIIMRAYKEGGPELADGISSALTTVLENIDPSEVTAFLSELQQYDFSNADDVAQFRERLVEMGWTMDEVSTQHVIDEFARLQSATSDFNVEDFVREMEALRGIFNAINRGEQGRIFDPETYSAIIAALSRSGTEESQEVISNFAMNEDGNFVYIGESMLELRDALQANTTELMKQNIKLLETEVESGNYLKEQDVVSELYEASKSTGFGEVDDDLAISLVNLMDTYEAIYGADKTRETFGFQGLTADEITADPERYTHLMNLAIDSLKENEANTYAAEVELQHLTSVQEQALAIEEAGSVAGAARKKIEEGASVEEVDGYLDTLNANYRTASGDPQGRNAVSQALSLIEGSGDYEKIINSPAFDNFLVKIEEIGKATSTLNDMFLNNASLMENMNAAYQEFAPDGLLGVGEDGKEVINTDALEDTYAAIDDMLGGLLSTNEITVDSLVEDWENGGTKISELAYLASAETSEQAQHALGLLLGSTDEAVALVADALNVTEEEARQLVEEFKQLEDIRVNLALEKGDADTQLESITQQLEGMEGYTGKVNIAVEEGTSQEVLDGIQAKADELGLDVNIIEVEAVVESAETSLDGLEEQLRTLADEGAETVTVTLDATDEDYQEKKALVDLMNEELNMTISTVTINGDNTDFSNKAGDTERRINSIDGRTATVTFNAQTNFTSAFNQIAALRNAMISLDSQRNVTAVTARTSTGRSIKTYTKNAAEDSGYMQLAQPMVMGDNRGGGMSMPITGHSVGGVTDGVSSGDSSGFASPVSSALSGDSVSGDFSAGTVGYNSTGSYGGASIGGLASPITSFIDTRTKYNPYLYGSIIGSGSRSGSLPSKARNTKTDSEEKIWENSFDRLYNIVKITEREVRHGNILASNRERALLSNNLTIRKLVDNTEKQIDSLKRQEKFWKEQENGRMKEINTITKEFSDVSKYARMDDNMIVQIDWSAIDRVTDQDVGSRITDYIKHLERIQSEVENVRDKQNEIISELQEIKNQGKDEYIDIEKQIMDAIVAQREAEIERIEANADAMAEANSEVLNNLRQGLNEIRAEREREEQLNDISAMERQLSLLQRDTSGANQLEILALQEQLAAARQSYTDNLIDTAIDRIDQGNEAGAIQREQQIQVMQEQLKREMETGVLWDQAYTVLSKALGSGDGVLPFLESFLGRWEEIDSMSSIQKQEWSNELREAIESGFAWYLKTNDVQSLGMTGKTIEFTGPDGKTYKGKVGSDGTITAGGKTFDNIYLNPSGQWVAESARAKPKPPPKAPASNSSGKNIASGQRVKANPSGKIYDWRDGRNPERQTFRSDPYYKVLQVVGDWVQLRWHKLNRGVTGWMKKGDLKAYKEGGLVDYTGLAWVDGTKSKPESFLDARDTENFAQLANTLNDVRTSTRNVNQNDGDSYYDVDITVESVASDYDVDRAFKRFEHKVNEAAGYRNVNVRRGR